MQKVLFEIYLKTQQFVKSITNVQNSFQKVQNEAFKTQQSFRKSMHKIKGRMRTLPRNIKEIEEELERLRERQKQSFSPKYILIYERKIQQLNKELRKIERKKAGGLLPYMGTKLQKNVSNLLFAGVGYLGVAGVGGALNSVVKLASEMEQTQQAFSIMLGSNKAAKQFIDQMNEFANRTPFTNKQIYQSAQLLKSFGIETRNILPYLQMLGDVSGGNAEKMQSLTLAFAQVQSAGKLTGQDLLQFINAGFNPLQELSEMTGKSIGELKQLMSQGKISADMVTAAFRHATGEGGRFYKMMEKQSQTLAGRWSTLIGKIQLLAVKIGNMLLPVIKKAVDIGIKVVNFLNKHKNILEIFIISIGAIVGAISLWIPIQWALNFALSVNPIGLWIIGIAALIGVITYAIVKIDSFYKQWKQIRTILMLVNPIIGSTIEAIMQLFKAINYAFKYGLKKGLTLWLQELLNSLIYGINKIIEWSNRVLHTKWKPVKLVDWINKEELDKQRAAQKKTSLLNNTISKLTGGGGGNLLGGGGSPLGDMTSSGIEAITSGGKKNITITVQSLVENLTVMAQDIKEGAEEIREIVIQEMLRVINSANEV